MKARIHDLDSVSAISTLQMAAYLRSRGWVEENDSSVSSTWVYLDENGDSFEVVLPLDRGMRDYGYRVFDLLDTLQIVEARSQLELFNDLVSSSSDVIRLRLSNGSAGDYSIPLEQGVTMVEKARDMMMAAACSAISPREFYPSRKPAAATSYLQKVRLGQTEQGSFVLTVHSPVAPSLEEQGNLFDDLVQDPFERQVTKKLAKGLGAIIKAAKRGVATGSLKAFTESVELGVSANLCDAVTGMQEETGTDFLDIRFSWSPVRDLREEIEHSITVNRDLLPVIAEASRIFRERSPIDNFELIGVPTNLHRPDGAVNGIVTVPASVEGSFRNVQITLEDQEYNLAIQAHGDRKLLQCEGELVREGRGYILSNPRNLRTGIEL